MHVPSVDYEFAIDPYPDAIITDGNQLRGSA
jgi:hypothetical protein